MKISCLPVSLFGDITDKKMTISQWASEAKSIGFDGIDISILLLKNRSPVYLNELSLDMHRIGIPIVMMTTYPDFTHPDPVQRNREFDYLVHDIALASQLEIKYLRILAGQAHPEMPIDTGISIVIDNFKKIVPVAEKYGVTLLYENHSKPGAWDYADFSFPVDIFLEICGNIRDTGIKLNFDTGNIVARGLNPLDVVPEVFDMVETVHISDIKKAGEFCPTKIGSGVVPNEQFIDYLKDNKFKGWLCIEEASGNGIEGIKDAFLYIQKILIKK